MKVIDSHSMKVKVDRRTYWVYIDECKTIWSCYCKRIGYQLCLATDWRYKKSEFKTKESVCEEFIKELKESNRL